MLILENIYIAATGFYRLPAAKAIPTYYYGIRYHLVNGNKIVRNANHI